MNFKLNLKIRRPEFRSVEKIWKAELAVAGALLLVFLGWDLWIYFEKAEANKNILLQADSSQVIFLKKENLEEADKKIREYREFLQNPKFNF